MSVKLIKRQAILQVSIKLKQVLFYWIV